MPLIKITTRRQFGINKKELMEEFNTTGKIEGIKPPTSKAARHISMVMARARIKEDKNAIEERIEPKINKPKYRYIGK